MKNARNRSRLGQASAPVIDMLESRRLLSTVTFFGNGDGTNQVKIVGTNGTDKVYVFDDNTANVLEVVDDKNGDNIAQPAEIHLFDVANVNIIQVDLKKGNDKFEYHGLSDFDTADRSIEVDLGDGNDSFLFTTNADRDVALGLDSDVDGADILDNSDFNLDIKGDAGKDTLTLDLSATSISTSEFTAQIDASSGDDTVNVVLPDADLQESIGQQNVMFAQPELIRFRPTVVAIDIDLGGGNDTLNQDVNTLMQNQSSVSIHVLGQSGNDTYNDYENFATENVSDFTVTADLGKGNDRYESEFNFNSFEIKRLDEAVPNGIPVELAGGGIDIEQGSRANFIFHGSDGNDKLEVDDFDETGPTGGGLPIFGSKIDGLLNIQLYGGDGNDLAEIDLHPGAVVHVGSSGIFRGLLSGDNGNDRLRVDILADSSGGSYDLSELGGNGNDSLGAAFQDDGLHPAAVNLPGNLDFGPRGGILLDGGSGTDKYDVEGNAPFKLRSVEVSDESLENPFL